ncbi:hypothetical protein CHS0354_005737 [Potamilus streckersoni]|uniref:Proactivator polypeptide n=1 Tax=Potamilus streckersoni TaxID=2493646 RepID=A0AAE0RWF3_9BIVA|nr:hypothetical protein CHS0354_005737 [Potamilus streckersoni]
MRLFLLATILSCALGSPLLGSEKCTWGPSYWCSHVRHAKECGAMGHCMTTVWKNQIIQHQSTETCTFCQLLVNEVRNLLKNKATQDEVAHYFSRACNILPSTSMKTECHDLVESYMPEILQLLESELSADMICSALGFCTGLEDHVLHSSQSQMISQPTQSNTTCDDCKRFIGDIQAMITSNETQEEVEQLLTQLLCQWLGSLEPLCQQVVEEYTPMVLQLLASQVDADITCRVLGFCEQDLEAAFRLRIKLKKIFKQIPMKPVGGTEECQICKVVVQELQNLDRDEITQEKVKNFIETKLCPKLASFSGFCQQYVEEYAPVVFMLLANELDPDTLCAFIGFCINPTVLKVIEAPLLTLARPVSTTKLQQSDSVKIDILCPICHLAMVELDQILGEKATKDEIKAAVDKVCDRLSTSDLQKQCEALIQQYEDAIIDFLVRELDPSKVCIYLHLCSSQLKNVGDDLDCELCTSVIDAVEKVLKGKTEKDVEADLKKLCDFFGNYKAQCQTYITAYGSLVLNLLIQQTAPKYLCNLIKMCSSKLQTQVDASIMKPINVLPIISIPEVFATVVKPDQVLPIVPGPKAVDDLDCKLCTSIIDAVEKVLKGKPKEDVKAEVKKICDLLRGYNNSCQNYINAYGDYVLDLLIQQADSLLLCKLLRVCQGKLQTQVDATIMKPKDDHSFVSEPKEFAAIVKPDKVLPVVQEPKDGNTIGANSLECDACQQMLSLLEKFVKNMSETDLMSELQKVCSVLPVSIRDTCVTTVNTYGPVIIDLLKQGDNAKVICQLIKLCSEGDSTLRLSSDPFIKPIEVLPAVSEKASASPMCTVCKLVMKELQQYIQKNSTKEEIKKALENVCTNFPATISQECKDFVDQYTDVIISLLQQEIEPDKICTTIGLCSGKLLKDSQPVMATSSPECIICEFVLRELEKYIEMNSTEAQIKAALENICTYLPDTISQECKDFVDQYTDVIISLLQQKIAPDKICTAIGLCSGKLLKNSQPVKVGVSAVGCQICKFAMHELADVLKQNATKEEIEQALGKLCALLPSTVVTECDNLVKQYGPLIISLLQQLKPDQICTALGLCSGVKIQPSLNVPSFKATQKTQLKAGPKCVICELVMRTLDELLKAKATQQEIENALEKVCSILPSTISQECVGFVQDYGPVVVTLLIQELDPSKVCTALKLCNSKVLAPLTAAVHILKEGKVSPIAESMECEVCTALVSFVDDQLKENSTVEAAIHFLEKVCALLPSQYTLTCQDIIKEYAPAIAELLALEINPTTICKEIGLCPDSSKNSNLSDPKGQEVNKLFFKPKQQLLGNKECTYGPSYWCASKENAIKCKAVEHCQKHVWKFN